MQKDETRGPGKRDRRDDAVVPRDWRLRAGFATLLHSGMVAVLFGVLIACGGGPSSKVTPPPPVICGKAAAAAATTPRASAPSASPQTLSPLTPQYFGMHIDVGVLHTPPMYPWPTFPIGTIRMHSTETRWSDMDKGTGQYDFSTLDQWRTLYQQHEVGDPAGDYQLILTLYSVPAYISSKPGDGCNFVSTSGHQPGSCDPPADVCSDGSGTDQAFTDFVTALAEHVNSDSLPKIHYWEIWNEPNNITFWNGTLPQLARLAQDARCVIVGTDCNPLTTYTAKGIDPSSKMLTPPPVTSSDETNTSLNPPSGWMAAYLAAGGGQYADIIGFHGYVEPGLPVEGVATIAQSVVQAAAAANEGSKPVWDTELGYSSADVPDPFMQAGWLAKAYLLQAGLGIERVAWFEYGASNVGSLTVPPAGTVENTAALDYTVLYNWLVGATATGPCTSVGTVWTCNFTLSGGAPAQAVWDSSQSCTTNRGSESCTSSPYTPAAGYTTYQDLQGGSHSISGSTVPIGAEPIFLE